MHAAAKSPPKPTLARTVAPEDLARGDYVALLSIEHEYPLIAWLCDPPSTQQTDTVRVRRTTDLDGEPLRVRDVCLPFVFVKSPSGEQRTLDVRSCELAKLNAGYGRRVTRALSAKNRAKRDAKKSQRKRKR